MKMPANSPALEEGNARYLTGEQRKNKESYRVPPAFFEWTNGNRSLKKFDHFTLIVARTPKKVDF
jgi:hypothetical protein